MFYLPLRAFKPFLDAGNRLAYKSAQSSGALPLSLIVFFFASVRPRRSFHLNFYYGCEQQKEREIKAKREAEPGLKRGINREAKEDDRRAGARNSRGRGTASGYKRNPAHDRALAGGPSVRPGCDGRECREIVRRVGCYGMARRRRCFTSRRALRTNPNEIGSGGGPRPHSGHASWSGGR